MRQWFEMKANGDKTAEILIYDEIGKSWWNEDAVSAKSFEEALKALGDDITDIKLRINSPGGDVFDGVAIHNTIKNHKAKVTAHIDGIAASAASYIAMAADKIVMPANSFLLIHGASGMAWGNSDDMRALADDLDRIDKSLTATYATRSGKTTAEIKAIMKEDRLMDATEAKDLGLCDEMTDNVKMAAKFSLRLLPKAAAEKIKAVAADETQPEPAPPQASGSEGPDPAGGAQASSVPAGGATVIQLDAARKEGTDAYKAYVNSVVELCQLAKAPVEKAAEYIKASKPIDDVRKELLAMRATGQDPIIPAHPLATSTGPQQAKSAWAKITDKINARVK